MSELSKYPLGASHLLEQIKAKREHFNLFDKSYFEYDSEEHAAILAILSRQVDAILEQTDSDAEKKCALYDKEQRVFNKTGQIGML